MVSLLFSIGRLDRDHASSEWLDRSIIFHWKDIADKALERSRESADCNQTVRSSQSSFDLCRAVDHL